MCNVNFLELISRDGVETIVIFTPDETPTREEQVNHIAQKFTDVREAWLTWFGKDNDPIVSHYKCTPKRDYLHMVSVGPRRCHCRN